jgi:GNAT superfamily N-acetyltransferase
LGSLRLVIQPATPQHIPAIVELLRACVAAMRAAGIDQWDEIYPTAATISADVEAESMFVGMLEDGAVAGVIVLNERQDPEYREVPWTIEASRIGVVHRLMVTPALQGGRLAAVFMRFIEERARQLGYEALRLDAFTQNPRALRLYARLGYHDAGPMRLRKGVFRGFEKRLV